MIFTPLVTLLIAPLCVPAVRMDTRDGLYWKVSATGDLVNYAPVYVQRNEARCYWTDGVSRQFYRADIQPRFRASRPIEPRSK